MAHSIGTLLILSIIVIIAVVLYPNSVYMYDAYKPQNWKQIPVLNWTKQDNKWVQTLSYCQYDDYCDNDNYNYKWLTDENEMGFVQKEPPADCTVICSDNLRKYVDKILKNTI